MFHVDFATLGGILDPLKSDLGVFWAKIPLSSDRFYYVKTQKTPFLQNSQSEMAKIENIHCSICTQPISSSWQNGLPQAFVPLEQRGVKQRSTSSNISEKEESNPAFHNCFKTTFPTFAKSSDWFSLC